MDILYFDNHIVVVKKDPGIPTQSEEGMSVESEARAWARQAYDKKGAVFLYAVHRLDKPVSGLLLLAKTSKALERLHAAFRLKQMKKTYVALVEGSFSQEQGSLENHLKQIEFRALVADPSDPSAKKCRLSYKVIQRYEGATLLEIDLETGRYHQIRCQLSHLGHPIVGDVKYGAKAISFKRSHIALHHQKMELSHPTTKQRLTFETQPTKTWEAWVKELSPFL